MKKYIIPLFLLFIIFNAFGQDIKPGNLSNLLEKGKESSSNAIIIYKDNKLVTETYFDTVRSDTKIESMSCTKSIVALAIACLQSDGLIDSLDVPVYKFYPEWRQGQKQLITLRHLLTMTSGVQNNPDATVEIYPSPDFVQLALSAELSSKPGEKFEYNNKALNLLAGVIKKITGKRMDVYIKDRLFKPLNINDYNWTVDRAGNPHVMSGCQLKPSDFIKIGLLLLNKGSYSGRQIISPQYIDALTIPCKQYDGYGLLWWIDHEYSLYTVDDEIINEMIINDISNDFINKIKLLKGSYPSEQVFYRKLVDVFGQNFRELLNENLQAKKLRFVKKENKGNITYRADGYLGNFIIVDPRTKIVAIRMISGDRSIGNNTNFTGFKDMVLSLTK